MADPIESGRTARAPGRWRLISQRVEAGVDAQTVFERVFRSDDHPWWLDSAMPDALAGGHSYLGSASGPYARVLTSRSGSLSIRDVHGSQVRSDDVLAYLQAELAATDLIVDQQIPGEFKLGWVGYLGYEYGARLVTGELHADETPDAVFVFTDRCVLVDHGTEAVWVLALAPAEGTDSGVDEQQQWVGSTAALLAEPSAARVALGTPGRTEHGRAGARTATAPASPSAAPVAPPADPDRLLFAPAGSDLVAADPRVRLRHDRAGYLQLVRLCREYIAAGESYELCLTNRITVHAETDPWLLYRRLRANAPRPFGAYLAFDHGQVLSASPERFLRIGATGALEAKPIKGTRPRGSTVDEDRRLAHELAHDPKELAENLMIVDLLRNDLGRVSAVGTVHTPVLFDVETYAGVHQLVSTVRGQLAAGRDAVDAVRATFPGGSMTGAPKERSMRILSGLEAGPRGIYSGALGFFSLDGAAEFAIVIRSIVWHPTHLTFGVGGAVTAGSDPQREWDEIVVKARTLGAALGIDVDQVLAGAPGELTTHVQWHNRELVAAGQPAPGDVRVLVADSWRLAHNRVRGLPAHRDRFVAAAAGNGFPLGQAADFFDAFTRHQPSTGVWFPRVRLVRSAEDELQLVGDLRPGPPRSLTARVRVLPPGDPRRTPTIKGPDLGLVQGLLDRAHEVGADEVLFRDADAHVLEAGYAALLWWEGDTLCVPAADLPILDSVTRGCVLDLARQWGVAVRSVRAPIEALDGQEAWLASAYQGLRLVTGWLDADLTAGTGDRWARWRDALEGLSTDANGAEEFSPEAGARSPVVGEVPTVKGETGANGASAVHPQESSCPPHSPPSCGVS